MLPTCYLNSNDGTSTLGIGHGPSFTLYSIDELSALDEFLNTYKDDYLFGVISYELNEHITGIPVDNSLRAPLAYFWKPETVVKETHGELTLLRGIRLNEAIAFYTELQKSHPLAPIIFNARTSKETYISNVTKIKLLIQRGDLYETNYCQEFFADNIDLDSPTTLYQFVNQNTEAPFSGLFIHEDFWLASGSPERFIKKDGASLLSQPIKGTSPRKEDINEDEASKLSLLESQKERAENVMIVDLVRNDLSKIAQPKSVQVDELFGLYSFKTVHQMISSVSCQLKPNIRFTEILKATFPMGSMTGAPKRNAVKYMKSFEDFNRELYSGSLGYIAPGGNFDFNVIIRSMVYYPKEKYISVGVGSAITIEADPEQEYEECILKVNRLIVVNESE